MNVIIVRPKGYTGGSLVLEKMCSLLREKGINASLFNIMKEPNKDTKFYNLWWGWFYYNFKFVLFHILCNCFPNSKSERLRGWKHIVISPVKGIKRKFLPIYNKNKTVVVYPEKVYGNFLHAKHVVRYFLYHYPYPNDQNAYNKNDLFIAYREIFNDCNLNKEGYLVKFNFFDSELYRQYNYGERKGNCYIIRKGKNRPDLPKTFDGPIIDHLPEEEKVRILNECERCYCYDTQTFYSTIAAVCGCISVNVPEPGKNKGDYLSSNEKSLGVAWGDSDEEIKFAISTREQRIKELNYDDSNNRAIELFISLLNDKFDVCH